LNNTENNVKSSFKIVVLKAVWRYASDIKSNEEGSQLVTETLRNKTENITSVKKPSLKVFPLWLSRKGHGSGRSSQK